MHTCDMAVLAMSYRKPFQVYLVVNEYTVPPANNDRVLIPRDKVPVIPIPVSLKPTFDDANNKHWLDVTVT